MKPVALLLALQFAAPVDAQSGGVPAEGPAAGPVVRPEPSVGDPDDWWHRRDRKLRTATITLGAIAGVSFLATGLFLVASSKTYGSAVTTDRAALGTLIIGSVTVPALIGVGAALGVHRRRGWQPEPDRTIRQDPRMDPAWAWRDRQLRGATLGLGVASGVLLASLGVTLSLSAAGVGYTEPDCSAPGSCQGPFRPGMGYVFAVLGEGVALGASAIALVGVGAALGHHRQPWRRWKRQLSLAPGGLLLRF